jgi:hypothetical protein
VLRAVSRFLRDVGDQLTLALEGPPRTADELLDRLRRHGLARITRCRLTRNRNVMVSFSGGELRVHQGYLAAPESVLRAIVRFVEGRSRDDRRAAQRVILTFPIARPPSASRRRARTSPEDDAIARKLAEAHRDFNRRLFGGRLRALPIRVSRRMRSRLGHYTAIGPAGEPAEIAISRSHLRRHGWEEALHTLLHEMVHQWQDEEGLEIDHGAGFRRKARELGITPSAKREVAIVGRMRRTSLPAISNPPADGWREAGGWR